MPAGYEWEYTTPLDWRVQLRVGLSTTKGRVTRFVVQLKYLLDGEWRVVARFDHDEHSEMGHDVTEDGLHLDVYRDGEKYDVKRNFRQCSDCVVGSAGTGTAGSGSPRPLRARASLRASGAPRPAVLASAVFPERPAPSEVPPAPVRRPATACRLAGYSEHCRNFPPVNLNNEIRYCEAHFEENADEYVTRFERWHDVNRK